MTLGVTTTMYRMTGTVPAEDALQCIMKTISAVNTRIFGGYMAKIKSNGGSSSYYDIEISGKLLKALNERNDQGVCFIKVEEMIDEFFEDSFTWGTMFKSMVRGYLQTKGAGKEGNDLIYELNKIAYYVNKTKESAFEYEE